MTKKEAIKIALDFVYYSISLEGNWDDPFYERQIEALRKMGYPIPTNKKNET